MTSPIAAAAPDPSVASPRELAKFFVEDEQQFQLGFLPTEQPHPHTRNLSEVIAADPAAGVRMILEVDDDVITSSSRNFQSREFQRLADAMARSIQSGGRVIFSGCGATGRLSILLEAMWKRFWQDFPSRFSDLAGRVDCEAMQERVLSIMTGGDRALIRSEENFEDFQQFGRQQMIEQNVSATDTVVAITEGGETSSVIGSAWQGLEAGAEVFFAFNNPAPLLARHIARSRELIEHPKVTVLDLTSGPMAVTGSTRLQATTSELLVIGSALEEALCQVLRTLFSSEQLKRLGVHDRSADSRSASFTELSHQLRRPAAIRAISNAVVYEQKIYEHAGQVTYYASDYALDILTDTTERAPTFMLPPFRAYTDMDLPPSWAFLKHPFLSTPEAWRHLLRRQPRGLTWDAELYRRLNAPAAICNAPPRLDNTRIHAFRIGCEDDPSRYQAADSAAVAVLVGDELQVFQKTDSAFRTGFDAAGARYHRTAVLSIGEDASFQSDNRDHFHVPCQLTPSLLNLWCHLAIKLVLNTLSTATMTRLGRVRGNWMIYAEATNKKLIDRAARMVQNFGRINYMDACQMIYEVKRELDSQGPGNRWRTSPAMMALDKLDKPS